MCVCACVCVCVCVRCPLTMSITILLRDCLCFLLRFWKMSQLSSWSSLKPTARWWFSRTDSSLYIRASSESVTERESRQTEMQRDGVRHSKQIQHSLAQTINQYLLMSQGVTWFVLTCVDEELVGDTRVVHVMDGCRKDGRQDLQIGEDGL